MSDETVKFSVLCSMFEAMLRNKSSSKKRKQFRTFLDRVYTRHEYFSAVRLVLPWLDRERGSYGLKEHVLATCIIDALGMSRESEDALRLINWRRGGAKTGANVGNFALVASEILQRRQGSASGGLTIKELNDLLDRLASTDNRGEKTSVLSDLIKKTNAQEMKWIVMIILKDLKLGISEKSIFFEFHPDAQDLFNVTCDLKLVCEKLKIRTQRYNRQDIEVGKPVRSQLALRVADATTAWKKLNGKQVVVECKFDGDRMQIHKNGAEIHFISRNFHEHPEYGHALSNIILQCVQVDKCILDGEMLVWDTSIHRFADFGSNQEIAKAEQEGLESDRQLCYVAFDILYVGDTSVIHQSLRERHDLLRKVIKPLKGRLEILVPNGGINTSCPSGEPCWSLIAYNVEDVERFFKETIENRDEGIVLKDLDSKWEPADRSAKWLKLKPDYIHPGSDLDVLIIGGYFGTGRRGGEVAQFLLGLAEGSTANSYPKRFISFCRVGTGLSDTELDTLVTKLTPYFRKNENPKKVPHFYGVTNKERPDVWIESPEKSFIVSINCDIRTIKSSVFASPYGLRFPRIIQVRYDKPWYECLDVQSFVGLVQSHNGNTQRGTDHGDLQTLKPKCTKSSTRGGKKIVSVVPAHLVQTDVTGLKEESLIFTSMMFYFVNVPSNFSIDSFRKMVVEHGGNFSMNLNDSVTHCIAAERKGIKYQAAMRHGDIIHYSWILDSCSEKRLLHLQPKYFLHFTDSSKSKLHEEMDAFSDYYYWDIDGRDIKQIFNNMNGLCLDDPKSIEHYKQKFCPIEKWCLFRDCHIYFYNSVQPMNMDCKVISEIFLRRLKLEVSTHGGQISSSLLSATHLVVFSLTESGLDFVTALNSFPAAEKHLLNNKKLLVLRYQWLEDSLEEGKKLLEDVYSLKPNGSDVLIKQSGSAMDIHSNSGDSENQIVSASPDRKASHQKQIPSHTNAKRGGPVAKQARRTRARLGNRPAKISTDESGSSDSSDEGGGMEEHGLRREESEEVQQKDRSSSRRKQAPNSANAPRGRRAVVKQSRRTRAGLGNRPAKISRDESKISDSSDETIGREAVGSRREGSETDHGSKKEETKGSQAGETEKISRVEEFRQTLLHNVVGTGSEKLEDTQGGGTDKGKEEFESNREGKNSIHEIEEKIKGTQNHECESTIDPLQALLLDMIPSLDVKNEPSKNAFFGDEKSQFNTGSNPVKKKRVSYKDVASQLLKDD